MALLRSVPRLDRPRQERLDPVEGQPPDLTRLDAGCAFRPRCRFAVEACAEARPPLESAAEPGHLAACFRSRRDRPRNGSGGMTRPTRPARCWR